MLPWRDTAVHSVLNHAQATGRWGTAKRAPDRWPHCLTRKPTVAQSFAPQWMAPAKERLPCSVASSSDMMSEASGQAHACAAVKVNRISSRAVVAVEAQHD